VRCPQAVKHTDPVKHRQAQIEHHQIDRLVLRDVQAVNPVVGRVYGVPCALQHPLELATQGRLIFNNQNTHH